MTPPAAMIFAAGLGTRMGALTRDRPKPLIPVAGRALVDHALDLVRDAGVKRVVVNTHAHAGQMAAHLERVAPEVLIAHEPELLETGGGLRAALPMLAADTVVTLNADMVWRGPNPLTLLATAWEAGRMGALLALVPRAAAKGHGGPGDFRRAPDGRLVRRGTDPTAPLVYAGAQIIATGAVEEETPGVFSLNRVWDRLLLEGRLFGIVYPGAWVDVGRPEGIALAETELAR